MFILNMLSDIIIQLLRASEEAQLQHEERYSTEDLQAGREEQEVT